MIPQEVITKQDQDALDKIAEEFNFELDHRKKFHNQVSDLRARIHSVEQENKRKEEEALKDPHNWEWKEGYKLHARFGVHSNGGVYLVDLSTRLEFFVPKDKIWEYRVK